MVQIYKIFHLKIQNLFNVILEMQMFQILILQTRYFKI